MKSICLLLGILLGASAVTADEKETITVSDFTFEFGDPWIRQQTTSQMRAGQFVYDHENEDLTDPELVIFYFGPGSAGGVEANIQRWIGQFDGTPESKQEEIDAGEGKFIFLEAKGTYLDGPPMSPNKTPKENYTMLAAILPGEQGSVFLKATGPNESMAAMKEDFMAFVKSAYEE